LDIKNFITKKIKKLQLDKFFMDKPPQNYGVSPKYGVTQFYLQPNISEHTPPTPEGWEAELT